MSGGLVLFKQQQTNLPEYNTLFGMPVKLQTTDDLSSVFSANNLTFSPEIRRTDLSSRFKGLKIKISDIKAKDINDKTKTLSAQLKISIGEFAQKLAPFLNNYGAMLPALPSMLTELFALGSQNLAVLTPNIQRADINSETLKITENFSKDIGKIKDTINLFLKKSDIYIDNVVDRNLEEAITGKNIDYILSKIKYFKNNQELSSAEKCRIFMAIIIASSNHKLIPYIEKVIESDKIPDNKKDIFIKAIKNNPEFAMELLNSSNLDKEYKATFMDSINDANIEIAKDLLGKDFINSEDRTNIIRAINDPNAPYAYEIINNYNIYNRFKGDILFGINKNTINLARKIINIQELEDEEKAFIISNLKTDYYEMVFSVLNNPDIPQEVKDDIRKNINTGKKAYVEDIINNPNILDIYKGTCLDLIDVNNMEIAMEVIDNPEIEGGDKAPIILSIDKNTRKHAREIIANKNILSPDKTDVIEVVDDKNIKYARKVIDSKTILSRYKSAVISNINEDKLSFAKELIDKIIETDKIDSFCKAGFIDLLTEKNLEIAEMLANDTSIESKYKLDILDNTDENNSDWVKEMLKFDNKRLATALIAMDNTYSPEMEKYHELAISEVQKQTPVENYYAIVNNPKLSDVEKKVKKIRYFEQLLPNISIENICNIVNNDIADSAKKDMIKLHSKDRSVVKHFSNNFTLEEILQYTKEGDVIEREKQLYINEGDKLFKWNMSKEEFDKLFPPVERFLSNQGYIGDCFMFSALLGMMKNPKARIFLYKCFTQDGNDILCTIRAYKDYGGTKRYPNGEFKPQEEGIEGCKGLQMLEHTYAETVLSYHSEVKSENLTNLNRIDGGFAINVFMDLTGASATDDIYKDFVHKVICCYPHSITREFLENYANNKNNCVTLSFKKADNPLDIERYHEYCYHKYDAENDNVQIINPHEPNSIMTIPFDKFKKLLEQITICNFEE